MKGEKKRRGRGRRRREEEKEGDQAKVWKLTLIMGSMRFGMDFWVCMMIILSLNLGFL